ncbi:MAG: 3-deoxy-7-phosphoheptulonate synthase [Enterococcus italicus]|jgi:3-deoxy-7-phosphoheptulonate synthase|uniref:3-deoxy-7-phosphoheptulonate synthase n=1 Tax=Enterococcus italicus TaxID=246144 RepID=UPI00399446B5
MSFEKLSKKINLDLVKNTSLLTKEQADYKAARDEELKRIITGEDQRFLLVIGPCSADNEKAVFDYAQRLAELQEKVKDKVFIVQRVYTNKPRTNGDGYKGMLYQQSPDEEVNLIRGMVAVRKIHRRVLTETGLTTADEMLYPENFELVSDLVSYHAVGARSVENQQHRFVASGIDAPVGLKNPTSGNLSVAFNALHAAQRSQSFIYNGVEVSTSSNPLSHLILRGGLDDCGRIKPNYHYEDLLEAAAMYNKESFSNPFVLIDTNHDNSGKKYLDQIRITKEVLTNRAWNPQISKLVRGLMIESYLADGRGEGGSQEYGQSITDPCLGWDKTADLVNYIHQNV